MISICDRIIHSIEVNYTFGGGFIASTNGDNTVLIAGWTDVVISGSYHRLRDFQTSRKLLHVPRECLPLSVLILATQFLNLEQKASPIQILDLVGNQGSKSPSIPHYL